MPTVIVVHIYKFAAEFGKMPLPRLIILKLLKATKRGFPNIEISDFYQLIDL